MYRENRMEEESDWCEDCDEAVVRCPCGEWDGDEYLG